MTQKERSYFIIDLYEAISKDLRELRGNDYKIFIDPSSESLSSKDFILTFEPNQHIFVISFSVGQMANKVAQVMALILCYLEVNEIYILEDSFFDKTTKSLFYGHEALVKKQESLLKADGKEKCVICDTVVPMSHISEDKICKSCGLHYHEINWC